MNGLSNLTLWWQQIDPQNWLSSFEKLSISKWLNLTGIPRVLCTALKSCGQRHYVSSHYWLPNMIKVDICHFGNCFKFHCTGKWTEIVHCCMKLFFCISQENDFMFFSVKMYNIPTSSISYINIAMLMPREVPNAVQCQHHVKALYIAMGDIIFCNLRVLNIGSKHC